MKNPVRSRLAAVLTLSLAVALVLAVPVAAHAAEFDVWNTVSIEMYDLAPDREPTLVMSALLRDDVELPADIAISVPKGAGVVWLGQVIDGVDPNSWPAIEDAEIEAGDGYDIVSFTLTDTRRAQLELAAPEGVVTEENGLRVIDIEWIAAGDSVRARVGISTPHEYHLENIDPEPVVGVRMSDIFYSIETSPVVEGSVLRIAGTLVPGEAPEFAEMRDEQKAALEAEAETATPELINEPIEVDIDTGFSLPTTWIIIGLLVLAIGVVAFLIFRNLQSAQSADADDADSEEAEEEHEAEGDAPADDSAGTADADWGDVDMGDE